MEATEHFIIYAEDMQSKVLLESLCTLTKNYTKHTSVKDKNPIIQKTTIIPTKYPAIFNICFLRSSK